MAKAKPVTEEDIQAIIDTKTYESVLAEADSTAEDWSDEYHDLVDGIQSGLTAAKSNHIVVGFKHGRLDDDDGSVAIFVEKNLSTLAKRLRELPDLLPPEQLHAIAAKALEQIPTCFKVNVEEVDNTIYYHALEAGASWHNKFLDGAKLFWW
jgi:hypothetical protein